MGVTINQLSEATSLSSGDKIPIYSNAQGDARKASLATLLQFIEDSFVNPEFTTIINAPTASGFTLDVSAQTTNIWMIVNPTGPFAAGTVRLPVPADCFDGQELILCTTQLITAFTLNGNGAILVGQPTSLGAGAFFTIRYNASQTTWYCTSQNNVSTFTNITATGNATVSGDVSTGGNFTLAGGINDPNGNELLKTTATAAAVNELTLANAATGGKPTLSATGGDANISINLVPKGTGILESNGVPVVTTTATQTITNKTFVAPALGDATGTTLSLSQFTKTSTTTVAGLPVAATSKGIRWVVSDSNAALTAGIGAVVAGGGANIVPVFCDGTNWRIG